MALTSGSGKRAGWLIAALFVLGAIGAAWAGWRHRFGGPLADWVRPTHSRLEQARRAYERGEWQQAADLARELVKNKEADPLALRIYARALARLERDLAAARIYNDRLGPKDMQPEDYFLEGRALAGTGNVDMALEVWEKGLQSGPDHPELLDHYARLSVRAQRLDRALEAARRLARQPGWEAKGLLLLGQVNSLLEEPEGAALALRQGLARDPGAGGAPFKEDHYRKLLARSLLQLGRPREALEALDRTPSAAALALDREALWLKSRALLQEGRLSEAAGFLSRSSNYRAENPLLPEPAPYVGSVRCTPCHAEIARDHEQTRHARTFHRGAEFRTLPLPDHPLVDPDDPAATHSFKRKNDRITVSSSVGGRAYEIVVEYAFGLPERYVTMVGRDRDGKYRPSRMSYFRNGQESGWTRTFGSDPNLDMSEKIRGEPIDVRDGVVRCLYCHVTRPGDFRDPSPYSGAGPETADAGIGCERCHGPGGNHLAAMKADFPDKAIVNVGAAGAEVITRQCADCHIVGMRSQIESAPDDPGYVRSPGVTLTMSRCYTQSNGGMSCLTCHDGHRDSVRAAAFYETKCLTCHAEGRAVERAVPGKNSRAAAAPAESGRVCKINPRSGCLECHMPKVPVPALRTSLTDHFIRIHAQNSP